MNKQDLIEKIEREWEEELKKNDIFTDTPACVVDWWILKIGQSLDLNGWVRVEEVREWVETHTEISTMIHKSVILQYLSTLAPQEENKN